jgi:hypothetical protein
MVTQEDIAQGRRKHIAHKIDDARMALYSAVECLIDDGYHEDSYMTILDSIKNISKVRSVEFSDIR